MKLSLENQPPNESQGQHAIQVPPNELDGSDMVPVFNQYVGFGDIVAANEVTAMMARKSKNVRLRMASSIDFADLRKAPTLLIGGITNRWTESLDAGAATELAIPLRAHAGDPGGDCGHADW
ncbi:hypothetical protein SBA3_1490026 [Candidatus Sulfopaludibacter sp. SbA3]|nr:hypothetical protein SBA3_1490026 [Candidatus Sulfopaludibacter sp. SbA3]